MRKKLTSQALYSVALGDAGGGRRETGELSEEPNGSPASVLALVFGHLRLYISPYHTDETLAKMFGAAPLPRIRALAAPLGSDLRQQLFAGPSSEFRQKFRSPCD